MKIKVRDFQSLGKVDIEATGLTVLVGPSNWGKSALVRAITAALFNRPGEDFIRHGSSQAQVLLEDLPTTTGTPLTVLWQKGHNLNRFTINGEVYDKVGQTAPPILVSSGYRDVFIGDKERNKGEDIRPQIGGQFDEPFLLKKLGSFINDVLSVVSRLGVLLNANGRCTKDLKTNKSTLTIRQKDLKAAEAKLTTLQPVVELHGRVLALQAKLDEARKAEALLVKVRTLVAGRAVLKAFVDATTLPEVTTVPEEIGVSKLLAGMKLAHQRAGILHVRELSLPERDERTPLAVDGLQKQQETLVQGRWLAERRPALKTAAAHQLDAVDLVAFVETNLAKVDEWAETRAVLTRALSTREGATTGVYNAISALNGVTDAQTEAEAALATALEGMTICPVCEQVMPTKQAAV